MSTKTKVIVMELCTGGSLYGLLDLVQHYYGLQEDEFLTVLFDVGECRARKSCVNLAWRYEIHAIIGSLGTVRAQPCFQSHVKSMGDFRLLQITVI